MPTLTEASVRALMAKTFGERLGPATEAATFDGFERILARKFASVAEPLFTSMVEAADEFIRAEMETLLKDIYLLLDVYDSDELTLKIMSDQNGDAIDFHYPIITLYDLILRYCYGRIDQATGAFYPEKHAVDRFIRALEAVIAKLKNTKSWTS